MPNQLHAGRAQGLRGAQFRRVDGAHASGGGDGNRRENRQVDQQDFRQLANAAPDHDQRQVGQWRNRPIELDQRVEDALCNAVGANRDADGYGSQHREAQAQANPAEARAQVLPQRGIHVAGRRQ
ncbi:hypothetical protein D3C73_911840 [compost metagenome]